MAVVLIVDDSWLTRRTITKVLKTAGYDLLEAVDGRDAMEKLTDAPPDCIVLDLLMPEMDGFEMLNAMSKKGHTIPIVVLSADIQDSTRARVLELGACELINKPPKGDELLVAVERALRPREEASP